MEEQQSIKEDHLTEKASKVAENTSEERPATIAEAAIKAVREEKTISETTEGRTSKPQSMTASESPLAVPEGLLQKEQKTILLLYSNRIPFREVICRQESQFNHNRRKLLCKSNRQNRKAPPYSQLPIKR